MGRENARRQEDTILEWFMQHSDRGWTPEQLHKHLFDQRVPLTSVRRAFSDLGAAFKLDMTMETREGYYGARVHVWRLAVPTAQMELV